METQTEGIEYIGHHHKQACNVLKHYFGEKPLFGIEIGTKAGDLTQFLLREMNIGILWTIDPWEHRNKGRFEAGEPQEYHNRQEEDARKKLHNFHGVVEIVKKTSDEAYDLLRSVRDSKSMQHGFDFVWIDGDHSEEQVRRDISHYWKLVRIGGVLGGHDYGLVGDVTGVVDEFMVGKKWDRGGDFTWWTTKKE